jgi:hypothetical protein
MLDKTFEDPWYGARAARDNGLDGVGGGPQLYGYRYDSDEESASSASHHFQFQDHNAYADYKAVVFPVIKYDYWKRIAEQGRGYKGLYYFSFDSATDQFKKFGSGPSKDIVYWVDTDAATGSGLGPGVYFFDTTTKANPQTLTGAARTAALTPNISWNSSGFNGNFLMQGFIYLNAQDMGTTGGGSSQTTVNVNFPGEPYRDVGYPVWCTAVAAPLPASSCPAIGWSDCNGVPCRSGAGDSSFSCQDLNSNGRCDVVVMPAPAWKSYDPAVVNHPAGGASGDVYVPKTWKSPAQATPAYGAVCTVPAVGYNGTNAIGTDCSEPHEPYLNFIFPTTPGGSVKVGWELQTAQTFRAKRLVNNSAWPPGTPVTCNAAPSTDDCVTNSYDIDGAVVPLDVILYGILYNEGAYGSQGNCAYFGSVLIQDDIGGTGTADVWFDEKLIKGSWAPPKMPRVIVFSMQTDEQSQ